MENHSLTMADATNMRELYESGNRTGMYIYYFEKTGEEQSLVQAQISSFSGLYGAVADCANLQVSKIAPALYPSEGVVEFSNDIALELLLNVEKNVQEGGSGVFSKSQMLSFDKQVWDRKGLGEFFPGNGLKLGELLKNPFNIVGVDIAKNCFFGEVATLGKVYGVAKEHFADTDKYLWAYEFINNTQLSYALDRISGKVVYLERSNFAENKPGVVKVGKDGITSLIEKKPKIVTLPKNPVVQKPQPTKPHQKILNGFGLNEDDLSDSEKKLLDTIAEEYSKKKSSKGFFEEIPFAFLQDSLGKLAYMAHIGGNPKLTRIAQVGSQSLLIIEQTSKLPGTLIAAPTIFAALQPVTGLAVAIYSLFTLFRSNKGQNPTEQISSQIKHISGQIEAMHKDMLVGFNMLLEGQLKIFTTMIGRFDRLESLVHEETERLGSTILQSLTGLENFLSLIHHDLSSQIKHIYLKDFNQLAALLHNAISSDKTPLERRRILKNLVGRELVLFENWLIEEAGSEMLNGYRFIIFLNERGISNGKELINVKLVGHKLQLECLIGYLGELAQGILPENSFGNLSMNSLINPMFWLKGVDTYIQVIQHLTSLGIDHDSQGLKLREVIKKGKEYVEFIGYLQKNSKALIENLVDKLQVQLKLTTEGSWEIFTSNEVKSYSLRERGFYTTNIQYDYNPNHINQYCPDHLRGPIVAEFESFKPILKKEVEAIENLFLINFQKVIEGVMKGEKVDELAGKLSRPICPIAKHRVGTSGGDSFLEVWHIPDNNPPTPFEHDGFKIPFILNKLFEHAEEFKAISPLLYLAELLCLGHFEITVVAHYVNGTHKHISPGHKILDDYLYFYNFQFEYEMAFITNQKVPIAKFKCQTDQVPVDLLLKTASVSKDIRKYIDSIHSVPCPPSYYRMGSLNSRLCVLSQVVHFTKVNDFTTSKQDDLIASLRPQIEVKIGELKKGYSTYFNSAINQAQLNPLSESVQSTQNLISAYLHLSGYTLDSQSMQELKSTKDSEQFGENVKGILSKPLPTSWKGFKMPEIELTLMVLETLALEKTVNNPNDPCEELIEKPVILGKTPLDYNDLALLASKVANRAIKILVEQASLKEEELFRIFKNTTKTLISQPDILVEHSEGNKSIEFAERLAKKILELLRIKNN